MKTWLKVARSATSGTVVTATVMEDNLTAKWSTKVGAGEVEDAAVEAHTYAVAGLRKLQAAMKRIEVKA